MNCITESPWQLVLLAITLFGAGLGFGGVTGKGWMLLNVLKNKDSKNGVKPYPPYCKEYLLDLQTSLPCREHSGLVADIKHLVRSNEEIKGSLNDLWEAVNDLRREVRDISRLAEKS